MAIFRLLAASILNKDFSLSADLTVLRDFTFIDDLCKSVESLMLQSHLPANSIFNIAGGKPHPLGDIFNFLESKGASVSVIKKENDPSDVRMTFGSTVKLENSGGYVPNSNLASGLDATWEWLGTVSKDRLANWYDYSS
jgi:nucleoside-diphosphate-sugar epimerase